MEDLTDTLIAPATLGVLDALAGSAPPVLVLLETPLAGLGVLAARRLARGWVSADALALDVHVARPDSDRWSIAEVDAKVIAPSLPLPAEHAVIVLDQAGAMDTSAAEHLLKTVEEPSSRATFLFCVNDAAEVLVTLRGRANRTVRIEPAPRQSRIDALAATGVAPSRARTAVELAGNQVALAPLLAQHDHLLEASAALDTVLEPTDPVTSGARVSESLTALASALVHGPESSKVDPATRAATRILVRELLARRRTLISAELRTLPSPARHRQLQEHLHAADAADAQLRSYAGVPLVLGALFASV